MAGLNEVLPFGCLLLLYSTIYTLKLVGGISWFSSVFFLYLYLPIIILLCFCTLWFVSTEFVRTRDSKSYYVQAIAATLILTDSGSIYS